METVHFVPSRCSFCCCIPLWRKNIFFFSVPFCNLNLSSILTMRNKKKGFSFVLSAIFFSFYVIWRLRRDENSFSADVNIFKRTNINGDVDRKRRKRVDLLNKLIIQISSKHLAVTLTSAFGTSCYSSYVSGSVYFVAQWEKSPAKQFNGWFIAAEEKKIVFIQLKLSVFHWAADQ